MFNYNYLLNYDLLFHGYIVRPHQEMLTKALKCDN